MVRGENSAPGAGIQFARKKQILSRINSSVPGPHVIAALSFLILAVVPLLQAFRGLDLTDTGFVATNQRLIFSDPRHIAYGFNLWLTNVLGGLVDLLFGRFGLLSMKLASAAIFWMTAWAGFKLYARSLPRHLLLLGIVAPIAFDFAEKINIVHYNNLSALFLAIGAWLIVDGCIERKWRKMSVAGFVLGLNTLVRLPNLLGLGLIFLLPILDLFAPEARLRPDRRGVIAYVAGAVAAIGTGFAVMAALGHTGLYFSSLRGLGASTGAMSSKYQSFIVLLRPARDGVLALMLGGLALGALLILGALMSRLRSKTSRGIAFCFVGCVALMVFFLRIVRDPIDYSTYLALAGIGYFSALAAVLLFVSPRDRRLRAAVSMAAAGVIILSIGSNTGIKVSTYLFPILVPGVIGTMLKIDGAEAGAGVRRSLAAAGMILLAILVPLSVFGIARGIYRDTPAMTRTVGLPQLAGIYTSPARADALEEAIPRISSYAPPGSELLAFDSMGLLHYATRTKPYLDNPWPALYPPSEIEVRLSAKEKSEPLPVVVLAKTNPRSGLWPENKEPPVRLEPVRAFMARNAYRLVWEGRAVSIYLPPTMGN